MAQITTGSLFNDRVMNDLILYIFVATVAFT